MHPYGGIQTAAQTGLFVLVLVVAGLVAWGLFDVSPKLLGVGTGAAGITMLFWLTRARLEHERGSFRLTIMKISAGLLVVGLLLIIFG